MVLFMRVRRAAVEPRDQKMRQLWLRADGMPKTVGQMQEEFVEEEGWRSTIQQTRVVELLQ